MGPIDPNEHRRVDRRTFLKRGLIGGGALVSGGLGSRAVPEPAGDAAPVLSRTSARAAPGARSHAQGRRPNILVILVDQLRYPQWASATPIHEGLPPNLRRLRRGAISFEHHYTASNDCTPSRSTLLTGLYTHQTGCMITGGSTLDPGFPTWGTMLREHGYHTRWLGKWHLTHRDNHWAATIGERALERYGFAGGVYPSPDGGPGQGWRMDPVIVAKFDEWYAQEAGAEPWCTTVSLVNPDGIAWRWRWSERVAAQARASGGATERAPNYASPELR